MARRHTRDYYNLALNLPQADAPSVAVDAAEPGRSFFVPKGSTFKRKVGKYEAGAPRAKKFFTWVYGFMGKEVKGKIQPDHSRRGWVPIECLLEA